MTRNRKGIMRGGPDGKDGDDIDEHVVKQSRVQGWKRRRQHHGKYQGDLEKRGQLAENARRKRTVPGNQENHDGYDQNQNVATQYDDGQPPCESGLVGEDYERRRKQQFVGDGIEIGAQRGPLIQFSRQQTVDTVAQARDDQHQQTPAIMLVGDQAEENRQKAQP